METQDCSTNTNRRAVQKRLNSLMGQVSSVPETRETFEAEEQTTRPEDCSSLCKAMTGLSLQNEALSSEIQSLYGDIQGLQKEIDHSAGQKPTPSNSAAAASQMREKFLRRRAFWVKMEDNERNLERCGEKLRVLKKDMETQTVELLQEVVEANNLLSREKEAWQRETARLLEKIAVLSKEKREAEELKREMDAITGEAKANSRAWDEEREALRQQVAALTHQKAETDAERLQREMDAIAKKKRETENKVTEAERANRALQTEVEELRASLQKEKELNNMNEARIRVHTRMDELRAQLEEALIVRSFDELLVEQLREQIRTLRDLVWQNSDDDSFFSNQNLGSDPDQLSIRRRFVRLFRPGWRSRYASRETVEYVEPGTQVQEEPRRRTTLRQRFVNTYNRTFRRT